MSATSFLDKLLNGAEVSWVPLGDDNFFEIANAARRPVKASLRAAGDIPYYGANNIQDYVDGHTHIGEYVLIAEDGSASLEDYSIQYASGNFWANNHVHVVRGTTAVNTRFLFHWLTTTNFLPFLSSKERAKLTKGSLVQITVPIPNPNDPEKSLAIQGEIVRILDTFTELTAELTAELTGRKKQYNHYRNQLLTFDEDEVEWKTLGEVAKVQRGASPRPISKFITDDPDGVPWIKIGDTVSGSKYVTNTAEKITKQGAKQSRHLTRGDFILSNSMSFGRPYILALDGAIHDGWASISEFQDRVDSDFLYHYLSSDDVQRFWLTKINSGSVSNLNSQLIQSLRVPLPPLAEQVRIAKILDTFDTLTTSLTEGLPREIALREKQYSYYRDLLFSFPKHGAEAA